MNERASLTRYIVKNFDSVIFSCIKNYSKEISFLPAYLLVDIEIKSVNTVDLPSRFIRFELVLVARYGPRELKDCQSKNGKECFFLLKCQGDLRKQLQDFSVLEIEFCESLPVLVPVLSDALLPYIQKSQLDEVAERFLERYFPSALTDDVAVDAAKLAQSLGLKIILRQINKEHTILGAMIFNEADVSLYDRAKDRIVLEKISGKTIIIDSNNYLTRNLGTLNNTIIHECIHWVLHRKSFELGRLFEATLTQCNHLAAAYSQGKERTNLDWMEWQANALTPRIQMPLAAFRKKVESLKKLYLRHTGTQTNEVDMWKWIIDELENFYHVSKTAAKIRLLDIGYKEVEGIYKFVDGRYIEPYIFKQNILADNQTFSIRLEDALSQIHTNQAFKEVIETGRYLFVDSHFCYNHPKYLRTGKSGPQLTDYARLHLDECCLIFELVAKKTEPRVILPFMETLYREVNSNITFQAHFSNKENVSEMILIRKRLIEIQELALSLPSSFSGTVSKLIVWSGLTLEEVVEKTLISTSKLFRMRTDENFNSSLESIMQLSIGLQLPPELSDILISHSTKRLGNTELHFLYRFLLNCYYMNSIYECNDLLEAQGFKRLGRDN